MITRFRRDRVNAALSASPTAPQPKNVRLFLIGYVAMWFFAGFVIEFVGTHQRNLRGIGFAGESAQH